MTGTPEPLGATPDETGTNFAVFAPDADAVEICLFDDANRETRHRLLSRTGDIVHGHLPGIVPGARYGLRAHGPYDPAAGHWFNTARLLIDPMATRLDRPFVPHATMFPLSGTQPDTRDSAPYMPRAIIEATPPDAPQPAPFDWTGQVIYELHVRGFTIHHPDVPPAQRGTFAALAHPAIIAHLKRLGVTAVELMPAAAWLDERHLAAAGLTNYWGYNPVCFAAPEPRLAPGGFAEIATAVAALHDAGIAVLLDVVFNHTGEVNAAGPTVSLRGLANAAYYRLMPGDPAHYVDDTGVGNTLQADHPAAMRLVMDALRIWVRRTGIDGFRFDLAATLGRRISGFDSWAPLLSAMSQDPLLRTRALIAEPWDVGPGGYRLGDFPKPWGEWNDRFRDTVRRFWRGDGGVGELATVLAGSADVFYGRPLSRSINFVTAHDGFTMADLVSYETKHNEANQEGNRDGNDDNSSWNHGIEGPTNDPAIRAARLRDMRALFATLLFARGTPMLSMGDEFARSQRGNNNAYAQDNEVSWLDWSDQDDLCEYVASLIAARHASPALRGAAVLTGAALDENGIPDVVWLSQDGHEMTYEAWTNPDRCTLVAVLYAEDRVLIALHAGNTDTTLTPPPNRPGMTWTLLAASAQTTMPPDGPIIFPRRSVLLLREE
jgi:glycogen debranching enzyme GlgX